MKKRSLITLIVLSLFLIVSCTRRHGEDPITGGPTPTGGPLFSAVRTVLRANCALSGCHLSPNPQNGVDFTDDNTIVAEQNMIRAKAVIQINTPNQMPPPPRSPLSAADRQKIIDWINAGG